MLVLERHLNILSLLESQGSARVAELAQQFGVTEETIRRDLDKLEAEGRLRRSHGGAILLKDTGGESPYWWREVAHEKEKEAIAHEAVRRVGSGERILLDASTTAWHMARRLTDQHLVVVTHSIRVAVELAKLSQVEVLFIGGHLVRSSLSLVGPVAERMLGQYHVDRLFLSCRGVDLDHGLSDVTEAQASFKRSMLDRADRRYLLVDHSKFGVKSLARVCRLDRIDEVITDANASPETLEALENLEIETTVVPVGPPRRERAGEPRDAAHEGAHR